MGAYVLVHGAWHGSWCWAKIVSLLQDAGHNTIVLDLPGRAGDSTPLPAITLDSFSAKLCRVIERQAEPVILVGHSMGGVSITQAAEQCPERIRALVYVAAFLLRDGQTSTEVAQADGTSLVVANVVIDQAAGSLRLRPEAPLREIFYGACSQEDVQRATAMLVPEALLPAITPVRTTVARSGRVPRVYVECLRDRAVPLPLQRKMQAATPCERVFTLDTDHSPFLSTPSQLAECLTTISS